MIYPEPLRESDVAHCRQYTPAPVEVWNCDTVYAGKLLQMAGFTPALLLMADDDAHPGGGVWSGSMGQEEDLHRRSDLCEHLEQRVRAGDLRFPLPDGGAVHASSVYVFRGERNQGYPPLSAKQCRSFVVLSAAPYNLGTTILCCSFISFCGFESPFRYMIGLNM